MVGSNPRNIATRVALALVPLVLALGAGSALAQDAAPTAGTSWRPRPVREGTVSLGGQALYGSMVGGDFSKDFNGGLGASFNLRYRTAADQAFGLSFEAHNFKADPNVPAGDSTLFLDRLQVIVTTIDFTKFAGVRSRVPKYVQVGAGLAQTRITDSDGEKEYPGDGGVFKVGGGFEYWVNRTLSLDLGVRYHGVLLRSKINHDVQVGLGLNFYTSP
ncbi:MAG: outer membrane beta-barrel protein [Candidatus Eisenbacteria bacterium]